jgi:hypothetical protein
MRRDQGNFGGNVRADAPTGPLFAQVVGTSGRLGKSIALSRRKGSRPPTGIKGAAGRTEKAGPACGLLPEADAPSITRGTGSVQVIPQSPPCTIGYADRSSLVQTHVGSGSLKCTRYHAMGGRS